MISRSGLFFLLITLPAIGFSQRVELLRSEQYSGVYEPVQRSLNYDNIQGSPYLEDELITGYVKFRFGDSAVHFLRYNIYTDEMEYLDGEKLSIIDNVSQLDHVYVNSHIFYFATYKFRNAFKQGYLEKLVEGKYDLYLKYHVGFEKQKTAESSYDKATPARFIDKTPTWYCSQVNGPIKNFEADKTSLEELFREDYGKIKDFIKSSKLKLRKQEDMIKLFEYYNKELAN